uniref:Uncharacterized protein n=1 Tax=Anguilla anguilla TaxID=7936 RepID=A0A0E9VNJ3_ANGAN
MEVMEMCQHETCNISTGCPLYSVCALQFCLNTYLMHI